MNPSRTDPTTIQLAILNTTRNNSTKGTTILNTATEGTRTDCLSRTNGCTILSDRTALRQMNHACCTIHKDPSEWPECEPPHHLYVQPIPESYGTADSHGANINTEALQPKCHNFETGTFSKRNSSPVQANHNQTLNDTATMMSPADNSPDDLEAILSSYYLPSAPAPRQLRTQTHKWAGELLHNILITEVEDLAGNYTQEELGTYIDSYAQTWVASWNTDSVLTACYSIADHPLPLLGTGVHPEIYPARKNYIAITTEPLRFFPEVPLPTVNPGQPWNWKIAICKARKRKHPAITAPAAHNPPSMEQPPSQQQPPSAGQVHFAPAVLNIHLPLPRLRSHHSPRHWRQTCLAGSTPNRLPWGVNLGSLVPPRVDPSGTVYHGEPPQPAMYNLIVVGRHSGLLSQIQQMHPQQRKAASAQIYQAHSRRTPFHPPIAPPGQDTTLDMAFAHTKKKNKKERRDQRRRRNQQRAAQATTPTANNRQPEVVVLLDGTQDDRMNPEEPNRRPSTATNANSFQAIQPESSEEEEEDDPNKMTSLPGPTRGSDTSSEHSQRTIDPNAPKEATKLPANPGRPKKPLVSLLAGWNSQNPSSDTGLACLAQAGFDFDPDIREQLKTLLSKTSRAPPGTLPRAEAATEPPPPPLESLTTEASDTVVTPSTLTEPSPPEKPASPKPNGKPARRRSLFTPTGMYAAAAALGARQSTPPPKKDPTWKKFLQPTDTIKNPLKPNEAFETEHSSPQVARFTVIYDHYPTQNVHRLPELIQQGLREAIQAHAPHAGGCLIQVQPLIFKGNYKTTTRPTRGSGPPQTQHHSKFALTIAPCPTDDQYDGGLFMEQAQECIAQGWHRHKPEHYYIDDLGYRKLKANCPVDPPSTIQALKHIRIYRPACNSHTEAGRALLKGPTPCDKAQYTDPLSMAHMTCKLYHHIKPYLDSEDPFAQQLQREEAFLDHCGLRQGNIKSNSMARQAPAIFISTSTPGHFNAIKTALEAAQVAGNGLVIGRVPMSIHPFPSTETNRSGFINAMTKEIQALHDERLFQSYTTDLIHIPDKGAEEALFKAFPELKFYCTNYCAKTGHCLTTLILKDSYRTRVLTEDTLRRIIPTHLHSPDILAADRVKAPPGAAAEPTDELPSHFLDPPKPPPRSIPATTEANSGDKPSTKRRRASTPMAETQDTASTTTSSTGFSIFETIPDLFAHLTEDYLYNPEAPRFVNTIYSHMDSGHVITGYETARHAVINEYPDHYKQFMHILMHTLDDPLGSPQKAEATFHAYLQHIEEVEAQLLATPTPSQAESAHQEEQPRA